MESQNKLNIASKGEWLQIAFEEKSSNTHIGDCAFIVNNEQAKIGFTISKKYQKRGFATEGVFGLLTLLFNELELHRIIAITDIENSTSINVLEKLGFRKEGHSLKSYYDKGMKEWRDEFHYAILKEEWETK